MLIFALALVLAIMGIVAWTRWDATPTVVSMKLPTRPAPRELSPDDYWRAYHRTTPQRRIR